MAIGDVDGDGRADIVLIVHDRVLVYRQDPGQEPAKPGREAARRLAFGPLSSVAYLEIEFLAEPLINDSSPTADSSDDRGRETGVDDSVGASPR